MKAVQIIQGRGVPLKRSDVDTDQIIPAEWLKRVERTGFEKGLFSTWRDDRNFVLNDERYTGASVLVAGPSFGVGSSREHAVWAIQQGGFDAVIAPSFSDIFRNNCTKNGLVPVVDADTGLGLPDLAADPEGEAIQANVFVAPYSFIDIWVLDPETFEILDHGQSLDHQKMYDPKSESLNLFDEYQFNRNAENDVHVSNIQSYSKMSRKPSPLSSCFRRCRLERLRCCWWYSDRPQAQAPMPSQAST